MNRYRFKNICTFLITIFIFNIMPFPNMSFNAYAEGITPVIVMKLNKSFKTLTVIMVLSFISFYNVNAEAATGTMIGGKKISWMQIQNSPSNYNRYTPAVNEGGDIKSANEIGIDYCELLELATIKMPGAFRVDYKLPNGTIKSSIYIIPKIEEAQRYSYVYFREEGTQRSLLPDGALYEQNTYSLRPGQIFNLTWKAKEFKGYQLTRSVVSKRTKKGFSDELAGEKGKVRSGELNYSNFNEFNVIFYYKKVDPSNKNIINSFYNSLLVKFIYQVK